MASTRLGPRTARAATTMTTPKTTSNAARPTRPISPKTATTVLWACGRQAPKKVVRTAWLRSGSAPVIPPSQGHNRP